MFLPKSSKPSVPSFYLCPLIPNPRQSGVSLEYPALENIPHFQASRAKVGQDHDARKAVSATLLVLK